MKRLRGVFAILIVLSVGAFAAGCGSDDDPSSEQLQEAREQGAQEAKAEAAANAKLDALQAEVDKLKEQNQEKQSNAASVSPVGGGNAPAGDGPAKTCTGGVQANSATSCEFAMNVSGEYGSNPGSTSIRAFSPATGQFYNLTCSGWSGGGTVCRGGNGAAVFLP